MAEESRFDRGAAILKRLFGEGGGGRSPLSKDFRKLTVENLFGDVWSRSGLAIEDRSMITIAALVVLNREQELRLHMQGARNIGISREKLEEILMHLAHYGGWPVAVAGFRALEDAFSEDNIGSS